MVLGIRKYYAGEHNYHTTVNNINSKKFTDVTGAKDEIPIIGSMQCVWSGDSPAKSNIWIEL